MRATALFSDADDDDDDDGGTTGCMSTLSHDAEPSMMRRRCGSEEDHWAQGVMLVVLVVVE